MNSQHHALAANLTREDSTYEQPGDNPYYPDEGSKEIFTSMRQGMSNAPTVDTEATSIKLKEPHTADKIIVNRN